MNFRSRWTVSCFLGLLLISTRLTWAREVKAYLSSGTDIWRVQEAAFGKPFQAGVDFNLLLPPKDSDKYLCSLPNSIANNYSMASNTFHLGPYNNLYGIGLLVPEGNCSEATKARVAKQMQQRISLVRYLVIYGTDPAAANTLRTLRPDSDDEYGQFSRIGLLYLPYVHAQEVLGVIDRKQSESSFVSASMLDPANKDWSFRLEVLFTGNRRRPNSESAASFYWFRFVLFALLIVAPCFRACYLWYAGGGRLHWQRNEHGRITGIQYIPPLPYWIAGRVQQQPPEPLSNTLTQEQFDSLPVIKYEPADASTEITDNVGDNSAAVQTSEEPELVVELEGNSSNDSEIVVVSDSGEDPAPVKDLERQMSQVEVGNGLAEHFEEEKDSSPSTNDSAESAAPEAALDPSIAAQEEDLTTTSTMCSICIDDFEAGEMLVILPKCKHAFHKDCIHPWLLERQGCCPMCKTSVLEEDEDVQEDASDISGDVQMVSVPTDSITQQENAARAGIPVETNEQNLDTAPYGPLQDNVIPTDNAVSRDQR